LPDFSAAPTPAISFTESDNDCSPLDALERNKDRVRILLPRYGIIFRELLQKEVKSFRWAAIFKALRIMELSQEITSGYFFRELPGPQFIAHKALKTLQNPLPEQQIYWLNACDPCSLCGLPVAAFKSTLPKRLESTHLVYRGSELVLISQRYGKNLDFRVAPEDSQIRQFLSVLHHLLERSQQPFSQLIIETINGQSALQSIYLDYLRTDFDLYQDHKQVIVQKAIAQ